MNQHNSGSGANGRTATRVFALACVVLLAWPDRTSAQQTSLGFGQTWLILGPYSRDVTGGQPGVANVQMDYLTDGAAITENGFVPTPGATVNTNYAVAASSGYLDRTGNGFPTPTVRYHSDADDWIDINATVYPPPTGQNNNHIMVYAWCWARNKTGTPLFCYVAVDRQVSMQIKINAVEVAAISAAGGNLGADTTREAWPVTLNPGDNLVMVKLFNGTGGCGFRLRFQTDGVTGAAAPESAIPVTDLEIFAAPAANAVRLISGLGLYSSSSGPLTVKVAVTRTGTPSPTVVEIPPSGGTVTGLAATAGGAPTYTGGRITWQIPNMAADVATMTYQTTAVGNAYCSGTVSSVSAQPIGGENIIFTPNPIGDFDSRGDIGIPPLGVRPGDPSVPGSATHTAGTYSITAAGSDIAGTVDRGYLLVKRVSMNQFVAEADTRWTSYTSRSGCKTCLMVRNSVSGASPFGAAVLRNYYANGNPATPQAFFHSRWRNTLGAAAGNSGQLTVTSQPVTSLRLVRRGNVISAYAKSGAVWVEAATSPFTVPELAAAGDLLLCFAVTSNGAPTRRLSQSSAASPSVRWRWPPRRDSSALRSSAPSRLP